MKTKVVLAWILFILVGGTLLYADEQKEIGVTTLYDLDATAITYCRLEGVSGSPFGGPMTGAAAIQTSGSSTTSTEVVASSAPFADLSVTDVIIVYKPDGTTDVRTIAAKASSASITLNSAADWSAGYAFRWYKTACGTSATSGWIDVSNLTAKTFTFQLEQVNVTGGIDVRFECKGGYPGAQPVRVYPSATSSCAPGTLGTNVCNFTAAGLESRFTLSIPEPWGACRVGMLIHTSDDGGDLTTNAEQVTIGFTGLLRK